MDKHLIHTSKAIKTRVDAAMNKAVKSSNPHDSLPAELRTEMSSFAYNLPTLLTLDNVTKYTVLPMQTFVDVVRLPGSSNKPNNTSNLGQPQKYTVKEGDTLWGISKKYKVTVDDLKKWNKLKGDGIEIGQKLLIYEAKSQPANNITTNYNIEILLQYAKPLEDFLSHNILNKLAGIDVSKLHNIPNFTAPLSNHTNAQNGGVHDISNAGLNFIAGYEGFSPTTYKDVAGLPTIGYGHLIKSGESFGRLTKLDATQLLRKDASFAVNAVNKYVKVSLTQNQFDALTSFTFNVGAGALSKSSLLRNVNSENSLSIDKSFMMWNKARVDGVLTPVQGLTNRRQAEDNLFLNGDY